MDERPADGADGTAPDDTDAVWRQIVENYGDRAVVAPDEYADPPAPLGPTVGWAAERGALGEDDRREPADIDRDDDEDDDDQDDDEDGFVPPEPPPVPRTTPARTLAWLGVLGSPAVVLVLLLTGTSVPRIVAWLLIAAFIGGFGYLVATMPREPRDPWDDGARV